MLRKKEGMYTTHRKRRRMNFNESLLHSLQISPEEKNTALKASCLETPLGTMIAIADEKSLYALEFADHGRLNRNINQLKQKHKSDISCGSNETLALIEKELSLYFQKKLKQFTTPLAFYGTSFQKFVWDELRNIPFAETRSYLDLAVRVGKPSAYRAVANANGSNRLALIVPCHRVIAADGGLGGYGSGLHRKKWLLSHEQK